MLAGYDLKEARVYYIEKSVDSKVLPVKQCSIIIKYPRKMSMEAFFEYNFQVQLQGIIFSQLSNHCPVHSEN